MAIVPLPSDRPFGDRAVLGRPRRAVARQRAPAARWATAWLLAACAGCSPPSDQTPKIGYYPRSMGELLNIHQVAMIDLEDQTGHPAIADGLTQELLQAIQRRKIFQVNLVRRTGPLCRDLPLQARQGHTLQQLDLLRRTLQCDAVLLGTLESFQTYPRMKIALYLVLLDLKDGKAIWVVDHTWDTTEDWTVQRIRRFFGRDIRDGFEPVGWELALRSPSMLEKFVAFEAADMLPAMETATPPAKKISPERVVRKIEDIEHLPSN